jgi:hypothetical protein
VFRARVAFAPYGSGSSDRQSEVTSVSISIFYSVKTFNPSLLYSIWPVGCHARNRGVPRSRECLSLPQRSKILCFCMSCAAATSAPAPSATAPAAAQQPQLTIAKCGDDEGRAVFSDVQAGQGNEKQPAVRRGSRKSAAGGGSCPVDRVLGRDSVRRFLPYGAQFLINLIHMKSLGVEGVADPFRELFVFWMRRIGDSV